MKDYKKIQLIAIFFKTFKNGYESYYSKDIQITTLGLLSSVNNIIITQTYKNIIHLSWDLHLDKRVKYYEIQRSVNKSDWEILVNINHRLMTEYIDKSIMVDNDYYYRVKAISFNGISSVTSKVAQIHSTGI